MPVLVASLRWLQSFSAILRASFANYIGQDAGHAPHCPQMAHTAQQDCHPTRMRDDNSPDMGSMQAYLQKLAEVLGLTSLLPHLLQNTTDTAITEQL